MAFTPRLKPLLPLLLLLICFWWSSFYGLNFGVHWDEARAKFDSVRNTLDSGLFLQGGSDATASNYNYGGLNYLLTWSGFAPEIMRYLRKGDLTLPALSAEITPVINTNDARLRVRAIYLILSSLAIVWLFCLGRILGRSQIEAFLGAAILAGSWEFAYHTRWIAPDAVMAQFCLLSLLCLAVGSKWKKLYWLYAGAAAAGLAVGTKYTGALLLPFFVAGAVFVLWRHHYPMGDIAKHAALLMGTAVLAFVFTTPGILVDPFRFFAELREQKEIYATGWYGYTVDPGVGHGFEILKYFVLQFFAHYRPISVLFAIFCLVGFLGWLFEATWFGFLAAGFVVIYAAYFSMQAAMMVRNLLVVAPFLCLASARGIMIAAARLRPIRRGLLYGMIGALLAVNIGWQIYAAEQVKKRANSEYFLRQFVQYVRNASGDTVFVSAKLAGALQRLHLEIPNNAVTNPDVAYTKVAFLQSEGADVFWKEWPSNWWGMYDATFGSLEVNLEAYSTFIGNERILVVTAEHFKKLPITQKAMLIP